MIPEIFGTRIAWSFAKRDITMVAMLEMYSAMKDTRKARVVSLRKSFCTVVPTHR